MSQIQQQRRLGKRTGYLCASNVITERFALQMLHPSSRSFTPDFKLRTGCAQILSASKGSVSAKNRMTLVEVKRVLHSLASNR